uniref:L1 transposable element RRM domain-containing protein n=1 Tax=Amphiprion percula TaxID=161767 RepID=A0A3P8UEM9_AMPPE
DCTQWCYVYRRLIQTLYLPKLTRSMKREQSDGYPSSSAGNRTVDVVLSNKATRANELDAITDSLMEKQSEFLEPRFAQLHEMGKSTDSKLDAIQAELVSLSGGMTLLKSDFSTLQGTVDDNSKAVAEHDAAIKAQADMEDRTRRCNIRVIGLKEGVEGPNVVQYLTRSLPKWFPSLRSEPVEIMRAHRIYMGRAARDRPRTLIFNTLHYTTRQAILRAAKKDPVTVDGKTLRFAVDYSNHTVKRRQSFAQAMDTARNRGIEFFLLYPATLKIKTGTDYQTFNHPTDAEDFLRSLPTSEGGDSPVPNWRDSGRHNGLIVHTRRAQGSCS